MDGAAEGMSVSRETGVRGIESLPDEILVEIFSHLGLSDLTWCSHTCRRWHALLREERALWRRRQCAAYDEGGAKGVLATAGAVPRLEALYLLYSASFGIRVAWPEATVFHHYGDAPLTWLPYFRCFDTECLVIDHSMQKNLFFYLSWVDRLTLRRIFVVEQLYVCSPSDGTEEAAGTVRSADCPVRSVRERYGDLFSGRSDCRRGHAGAAGGEACPALEEVHVYCKYLWDERLDTLCGLGPLRALHVRCQRLCSLTFMRHCRATLEVLEVSDCRRLLQDAFDDLRGLERLRVLRLWECRVDALTVAGCVADLPCLESCLLNGREILQKSSS